MAVAVENAATALAVSGGTLAPTLTITSATIALIGVGYVDGSSQTSSVTWDLLGVNQPFTLLKRQREAVSTGYSTDFWYLLNPTPGASKLVTVVMSGATNTGVCVYGLTGGDPTSAASAFGDTTLTGGTADSESGASGTASATAGGFVTGALALDMLTTSSAWTDSAQIEYLDDVSTGTTFGSSTKDSDGSMSWTKDGGGTTNWCYATVCVLPVAAAGGHPTMRRWGGVPFMGGQGIGQKGGGGGRAWGRRRSGIVVPARYREAA